MGKGCEIFYSNKNCLILYYRERLKMEHKHEALKEIKIQQKSLARLLTTWKKNRPYHQHKIPTWMHFLQ